MALRVHALSVLRLVVVVLVVATGLALTAGSSAAGSAGVFHVSPSGSDGGAGSAGDPWRTLEVALGRLGAGDTLVVGDGEYVERVGGKGSGFVRLSPGTASSPVVVRAAAGARPVLRGLLWLEGMDHWTFDGLNVTWDDATGAADEHMVRLKNGVGWTFQNAEIWGARSYANLNVLSDTAAEPADWTLRGNCIRDNHGDPGHGTAKDQLLYVNTGLTAGSGLIERNVLFGAPRGKALKLAGPSSGTGSTDVTVRYNTIVDTYKPPVNLAWDTTRSSIHHNLIGETAEPTKGLVRGYELAGTDNRVWDNFGWGSTTFVWVDGASSATVESAANTIGTDPGFDHRGCDGFRPSDPAARAYGHTAPDPTTTPTTTTTTTPTTTTTTTPTTTTTRPSPTSEPEVEAPSFDRRGASGTIYRLYRAYFLREPDLSGFRYWLGVYRAGYPLGSISDDFARSGEFRARYGTVGDREFVRRVYRNVLGRNPDNTGFAYWIAHLRGGLARGHLMIYFSDGVEFRRITA